MLKPPRSVGAAMLIAVLAVGTQTSGSALAAGGGGRWSAPQKVTANGVLFYVSCPTSTFCVSPSLQGPVYVYSSGRWSAEQPKGRLAAVSCGSASSCVALELSGKAVVLDGRHWSDPVGVFPGYARTGCQHLRANVGHGLAPRGRMADAETEPTGVVVSYDAGHWSKPINVLPPSTGAFMSCPAIGRCMMLSATGRVAFYNSGGWTERLPINAGSFHPTVLTCGTPTFCVVGSNSSQTVFTYDGKGWPRTQLSDSFVAGPSCTGLLFCLAVGTMGDYFTYKVHWSDEGQLEHHQQCRRTSWLVVLFATLVHARRCPVPADS